MLGENRVTIKAFFLGRRRRANSEMDEGKRGIWHFREISSLIATCFSSTAIFNKYAKIDKPHIGV